MSFKCRTSVIPFGCSAAARTYARILFCVQNDPEVTGLLKSFHILALFACATGLCAASNHHATGTIHTEAVDIGYESFGERGTALPVIAVNGGPGLTHAYMLMNDMWQQVALHRLVMFYDQRGTGASRHLQQGASFDMNAQVADLEAVRAHFGLEKVALVGDSYGGLLAMAYAAAHPEHVAKLVLSDSAPPQLKDMPQPMPLIFPDVEQQEAEEQQKLASDPDAAARASLHNHFRMIFYSAEKRDAYMARMGTLGYEPAIGEAVFKEAEKTDLTPSLSRFRFPVLVLTGRYDLNVVPLTAWRIAHAIPGAQIVFFEQSGHLPSFEEPEKYRRTLESFLDDRK
jgi:proline iminopeptidase